MESLVIHKILLYLSIILVTGKLGAVTAGYLKFPAVLGELAAGIIIGNLSLFNFNGLSSLATDHDINILAELGIIILLFEVGLESKVSKMLVVGSKSLIVALVGVITPFIAIFYLSDYIIPGIGDLNKIFLGATLTATSVGITARIFKDLNFTLSKESRVVLGAAIIDDILGLMILAVIMGMVKAGQLQWLSVLTISAKAIGFVVISITLGVLFSKKTIKLFSFFKQPGVSLTILLVQCFLGAYLANQFGLATIVGAFCAGLVLEDLHFKPFNSNRSVEEFMQPISLFLVPIFFVLTGMKVNLRVFADPSITTTILAITAIAIMSKLICGWAFSNNGKAINRLIIGIGMIPRGEVGLIFATIGKSIGVFDDRLFAITIVMVMLTTLIPPLFLGKLIERTQLQ